MIQNILVLTDFSDYSLYAAKVAVDLGRKVNAKIHFLHVTNATDSKKLSSQKIIETKFKKLEKRNFLKGISVVSVIKYDDICYRVMEYEKANDIDLIVTGSMKASSNTHSLSSQLKDSVKSPVLAVRSEFYRKKNDVLHEQNVLIEQSNIRITAKQKELADSLSYARRIQNALLPSEHVIKKHLKSSFILYKPKDIVAGDFYWVEHVNDLVLFAAADCTGHGVPGAMISVVCNNALNHAVREHDLIDPGLILDTARKIIIKEFEKSTEDTNTEEVKDGMDIALCSLEGNKLKYAGALNPLWIIRKGEVLETKGNKQPIGKFDNLLPYTTHSFQLEEGDTFYIFSDGYADQFGGEKGKKFKKKAFRELLLSIQDKAMEEQKSIIDKAFEKWKGNLEQVDDVCVIGVRI